jgi:hypothetical protein
MTLLACIGVPVVRFAQTRSFSTHFDPAHSFSASCRLPCSRSCSTIVEGSTSALRLRSVLGSTRVTWRRSAREAGGEALVHQLQHVLR